MQAFDTSRPIYIQIVERLTRKIISGEYALGSRLPSVRDIATEFGVNPNTMQRAFAELERQSLLYTERTAGRFVTQDAGVIRAMQHETARQVVAEFTAQMAQMGYRTEDIIALLQKQKEKGVIIDE